MGTSGRPLRTLVIAASAVVALSLGACGASKPSYDDAGQGAGAATGPELSGDGFAFRAPKGWTDGTSKAKQSQAQIDVAALAPQQGDFRTNLNVIVNGDVVSDGEIPSSELTKGEKAATKELTGAGFSGVTVGDRLSLDDEPMLHLSAKGSTNNVSYQTEQYYAFHDGDGVIVTFSFPGDATQQQKDEVVSPTFASWSWS